MRSEIFIPSNVTGSHCIDMTGQKFGRLTVIERVSSRRSDGASVWKCKCECGNEVLVARPNLIQGNTKSCGYLNYENNKKYNKYSVYGDITFVKFSNCNEYFLCDTEDWYKLKDICWKKDDSGYAITNIDGHTVKMHRLIMNQPINKIIDHIYRVSNGILDNRKKNLFITNKIGNGRNRKLNKNNKTGVRGVTMTYDNKFCARISVDRNLGKFSNLEDATKARKEAELKYWGKSYE